MVLDRLVTLLRYLFWGPNEASGQNSKPNSVQSQCEEEKAQSEHLAAIKLLGQRLAQIEDFQISLAKASEKLKDLKTNSEKLKGVSYPSNVVDETREELEKLKKEEMLLAMSIYNSSAAKLERNLGLMEPLQWDNASLGEFSRFEEFSLGNMASADEADFYKGVPHVSDIPHVYPTKAATAGFEEVLGTADQVRYHRNSLPKLLAIPGKLKKLQKEFQSFQDSIDAECYDLASHVEGDATAENRSRRCELWDLHDSMGDAKQKVQQFRENLFHLIEQRSIEVAAWIKTSDEFKDGKIDVHFLTCRHACHVVKYKLTESQPVEFRVITGHGKHSPGGKSKLRPAIQKLLDQEGVRWEMNPGNEGEIIVKWKSK